MRVKLTVAVDNCVPINSPLSFLGEHGLSMLIETAGKRLLLDTGASSAVVHNLDLIGAPPACLDLIAISHGHHDHTGGLFHVLSHARKSLPVYLHEAAFKPRFAAAASGERRFAGIPHREEQLSSLGADWRKLSSPREMLPGLWASGTVPRTTAYETGDARLRAVDALAGCDGQDDMADDMALYCRSDQGLVVISGCAHAGLVNMVRHGLAVTGAERLHGWIGGTHLGPVGDAQQSPTIAQLKEFAPDFVAANHCTGFKMMARLEAAFGDRFIPAFVGTVIEF